MTGPPAATASVRVAVRRCLAGLAPDAPVAAALSGGADSLALAAALAFVRPGACALVVDHGLQSGSERVAARAAEQARSLGLTAAVLPAATSARSSGSSPGGLPVNSPKILGAGGAGAGGLGAGGPEAAARRTRYAALDAAAHERGLAAVLLGHTLDDQAETVLLGLARGSGARALAGMASVRGRYRRPLLELDRVTVRRACVEAGLVAWEDPHNADPAYARVRVRASLLPLLEQQLGPGIAGNLARTARQLREDADTLDALAPVTADVAELAALPAALRSRALKRWAEQQCGAAVTAAHVDALRSLVDDWHGQGAVGLPGGVLVERRGGRLASQP
ncbi:MAG: tRNA lysidine(34) synthetase TilS [Mycobacteriales bacterium]